MGDCFGCQKHYELMQLRKKVESYESKAAYLKLDKQLRTFEKKLNDSKEEAATYLRRYYSTRNALRSVEFELEISKSNEKDLKQIIDEKDQENARLNSVIKDLEGQILKLKAQINRDYTNSSMPSSKEESHKKIANSRIPTGRKPGAQKGHTGTGLKRLTPTRPPVCLPVPEEIANSEDYYPTGKIIKKQVIDIKLSVEVTEYWAKEYRCRSTGSRWHPEFPPEAVNPVNYGASVKATAFLLNNYCNVSIDKVSSFLNELSEGAIKISKGTISNLASEFSVKTEKDRKDLFDTILRTPVMYVDATVGRVNGKNNAIFACNTENEVLYFSRDTKGVAGITGTPIEQYPFTLVHDHDKVFYKYGGNHQECLAHVLRYLQDSIDNEPTLTWNHLMKNHLSNAIHIVKSGNLSKENHDMIIAEYERILLIAESEYEVSPPSKYYRNGFNLFKRMKEFEKEHLFFLDHPEVGYTNNISERNLRAYKRKQKQAVTFRSKDSQEHFCDALTIIKTNMVRGNNIYNVVKDAFAAPREKCALLANP